MKKEKPFWLRTVAASGAGFDDVRRTLRDLSLRTVCDSSQCPNIRECWSGKSATFMILGGVCTRNCAFCAVAHGDPHGAIDECEPERVAKAVGALGLRYAVVTSVARDDLSDGGAAQFSSTVRAIKDRGGCKVEILIPDMGADDRSLSIAASGADVVGHNIETVERLQKSIRDHRASYSTSLLALQKVKELYPNMVTKSSLMLGLGEERSEVLRTMKDLRDSQVEALTIGQYLQPRGGRLPVFEYVNPTMFAEMEMKAKELGFRFVKSGPFVRSSYRAYDILALEGGK